MPDLSRLLNPKSIALFGGSWAENVIEQLQKSGYQGDIWPVHPTRNEIRGIACFSHISQLPCAPDAGFIGVNREASIEIIASLSQMGAGGATCFASGFLESEAEETSGAELQSRLVKAAGHMPILGPNCYGLLNYLDNVTLWPDQHGARSCEEGVAIIGQSSNVLINMTMQKRALPIAYAIAAGNQAQVEVCDIASHVLEDDRVTAIGLYIEGFGDIRKLEAMAARAKELGKPVIAIKAGKSEKSRLASLTHTASLAGGAKASSALMERLGIVEVNSIAVFIETLKLLHGIGPLKGNAVSSMSCSGGEAGLVSDMAEHSEINFREISATQTTRLKELLGPIVSISNPLDYHTFIWGDEATMADVYSAIFDDGYDLNLLIMDVPPRERCDPSAWQSALDALKCAKKRSKANIAMLASLPENLCEELSDELMAQAITPLHGMEEAILAIDAAIKAGKAMDTKPAPALIRKSENDDFMILNEAQSKDTLSSFGVRFPMSATGNSAAETASLSKKLSFPVALKGLGIAHKSEAGAVRLNLQTADQVLEAAESMTGTNSFLVEEMVRTPVAEILIGVTRDETGLMLLTIGAGGIMAELVDDTISLVVPSPRTTIETALGSLGVSTLLKGFRGNPATEMNSLMDTIEAVQDYCLKTPTLIELDINPVMALDDAAIAVDALIKLEKTL